MKKKILVAVDGSDYSHKAFKHALKEAKKQESHLTILKVVPNFGYDEKTMEKPLKKEIKKAEELTEEWKEKAEKKGIEADARVITETDASTGIVKFSKKENYDLIIVGSRGKTDLETIQLGSVSEGVVKRAHIPVLIIR
ncbi:hypothetical protein AKJ50_02120 [candidate division MSBL1 archaeon SCGC-AAA382A13]|uniref:UspA domain-containing protein n=1 Tax=candidate division MSBL1 archaeon SCGC-AAA382A13 TaxID=1698279 RepID=A0A133VE54_9EURY|nr:hypothetical protein AKJ50_02120 [candidate division MSBL1 archaeon SCGC-AAA382A13]